MLGVAFNCALVPEEDGFPPGTAPLLADPLAAEAAVAEEAMVTVLWDCLN